MIPPGTTAVRGPGLKPPPALGILAGNGEYPLQLAARLRAAGIRVSAVGIEGEANGELSRWTTHYQELPLGALGRTSAFFHRRGIREIFFAGGVRPPGRLLRIRPDWSAAGIGLVAFLSGDDRLLRRVADWFLARGISVADPSPYIGDLFAPLGQISGPTPTSGDLLSLATAWRGARQVGKQDKGQAALASGTRLLAVEGRGGTDPLIRDSGRPGGALAKVVKPGQDRRFDMPAIGPRTIFLAARAGLTAVGVQGGGVLLLNRSRIVDACAEHGISLIGFPASGPTEETESRQEQFRGDDPCENIC